VKLIWGPPGTGKTKTISATLWALKSLKCRTLMCSPTNISVVGVCTRLLQDLKDLNEYADTDGLPNSFGDIVLLGNKQKMDSNNIQEILLDYRVDQLVNCFSSSSGWKNRIVSLISLLEDFGRTGPSCLQDFHKQFGELAIDLKECILNLWIHLPKRCFSPEVVRNILELLDLLKTMCDLLSSEDFTYDYSKRGFYVLSAGESISSKHVSLATKWVEARFKCLELLKSLKISFDLPVNVSKSWARNYCMHNATLIFCTVSSSYHIHDLETTLDVLIIDEAAQVRECESVIPLCLNGLRHALLVGDDCQ
jgi:superfamily I DNA and/or RNA helicase